MSLPILAMKYLFTARPMIDGTTSETLKGFLDEANIPSMIRNEHLSIALGEIPPTECSPELWILNDADYPQAKEIVDRWQASKVENQRPWICSQCGESIEGQFTSCWRCGRELQTEFIS
jgi:hypothetical protein